MALSIKDLQATMDALEDNFDAAYKAAPNQAARDALRSTLTAARDAYWRAAAHGLTDQNDFVLQLAADLKQQNLALEKAAANLKKFTAFLAAAKEAVKLAAAIAALAAA